MAAGQGIEPQFYGSEPYVLPLDDPAIATARLLLYFNLKYAIIQLNVLQKLLKFLDKIWPAEIVYAHCDIPCGIYTTHRAMVAAQTVEKMVVKLLELTPPGEGTAKERWLAYENAASRMVMNKEEAAKECKSELLILWTDYFKEEHLKMFPDLHETFWKAAKLCSKNKQNVDLQSAQELRKAVAEIDEMFRVAEASKKK